MLDPKEREEWREEFYLMARRFVTTEAERRAAARWAKSMSLIAEQFYEPEEDGEGGVLCEV